jgi:hypothetical protein
VWRRHGLEATAPSANKSYRKCTRNVQIAQKGAIQKYFPVQYPHLPQHNCQFLCKCISEVHSPHLLEAYFLRLGHENPAASSNDLRNITDRCVGRHPNSSGFWPCSQSTKSLPEKTTHSSYNQKIGGKHKTTSIHSI